jgi:hypothetical protein
MSQGNYHYHLRPPDQITGFFAGLEMVEPQIVTRGDPLLVATWPGIWGIGRKP